MRRLVEKFKIDLYRLITGGIIPQLLFLFLLFISVFITLTYLLNMESSQLFHNMTSFDYPPQENQYKLQIVSNEGGNQYMARRSNENWPGIGGRVVALRTEHGMTQEALAQSLNDYGKPDMKYMMAMTGMTEDRRSKPVRPRLKERPRAAFGRPT